MVDARLEELVAVFARGPQHAFVDGGPALAPLPWEGLSWKDDDLVKRSNTFETFCTSLALRDYRMPLGTEVDPASGRTSVFCGGFNDRVLDGVVITWGDQVLSAAADVNAIIKSNPDASARILFVQAKMSDRIREEDVERFGGNVQGFLTEEKYLSARTSDQIKTQRKIYDALRATLHEKLQLEVILVFVFHGARGNFRAIVQVRDRVLTNLGNHRHLAGVRVAFEIWDGDDICQAAMLAGIAISRNLENVRAMPFDKRTIASGFLAIVPGASIVKAFAPAKADPGAEEVVLDPQFFLENPRHDLGDRASANAGASALARDVKNGKQAQAFVCHNGLTIVARRAELRGTDTIILTTPQVVNGCQSSYALGRLNKKLSGSDFVVKVVATDDERLKDAIVLGANTQEEIETWDILARRRFVRELEREFDRNWKHRLWLERRHLWREIWEQQKEPVYPQYILTPRQLMDGFAATILGRAHTAQSGPAQVLPLVQDTDGEGKAKGRIFSDDHEPALYRAIGWLVAAGRMWGQSNKAFWNDHPGEEVRGQYHYRHQFVGALWRIAESEPDRVGPEDLSRGRYAQDRSAELIEKLADNGSRKQLTAKAAEAIDAAKKAAPAAFEMLKEQGKVRAKHMPDLSRQAWFTDLVRTEADRRRVTASPKGWFGR